MSAEIVKKNVIIIDYKNPHRSIITVGSTPEEKKATLAALREAGQWARRNGNVCCMGEELRRREFTRARIMGR